MPRILNKVGIAYQQLGDLQLSERFYKRAIHADKNFASAVNNCGTVEYDKKHYGKAISLYTKALGHARRHADAVQQPRLRLLRQQRISEAMNAFEKGLTLDPVCSSTKARVARSCSSAPPPIPAFFISWLPRPTRIQAMRNTPPTT